MLPEKIDTEFLYPNDFPENLVPSLNKSFARVIYRLLRKKSLNQNKLLN